MTDKRKRARTARLIDCARCGRERPYGSRGLCAPCRVMAGRDGTLDDYPRLLRRREDTAEDYAFLREQGLDHREIAACLQLNARYLRDLVREVTA